VSASESFEPQTIVLRGSVPSKKNDWKRGSLGIYLPKEIVAQIDGLILQAKSQWHRKPLEQFGLRMHFIVKDGRSDLDNKCTCAIDLLVKAGVLRNDSIAHLRSISATAAIMPMEEESVRITLL
jgi:hypothetical protein